MVFPVALKTGVPLDFGSPFIVPLAQKLWNPLVLRILWAWEHLIKALFVETETSIPTYQSQAFLVSVYALKASAIFLYNKYCWC